MLDVLGEVTGVVGGEDLSDVSLNDYGLSSVLMPGLLKVGGNPRTDREFTDFFDEVLAELIDPFTPELEQVDLPVGPDLKWRYSSAVQKGVRRSDATALYAALASLECDPDYFWRRTPVVAMEDIAMADPWLVGLIIHACRFKRVRTLYKPQRTALILTNMLVQAVKSRTTCDLICLPMFNPAAGAVRKVAHNLPKAALAEIYHSSAESILARMTCGFGLAGSRWGSEWHTEPDPAMLLELIEATSPPLISWTAKRYSASNRDGMWIGYPLEFQLRHKSPSAEIVSNDLPPRRLVQGVLDATFDGHVREGRSAIAYFAKACAGVREFFEARPAVKKQATLGMALFTADSALLDREYRFDGSVEIYLANLYGELAGCGLGEEEADALLALIDSNRDVLFKARTRVTEK